MILCPDCKQMDDPSGPGDGCNKCGHAWTSAELVAGGFDPDNF